MRILVVNRHYAPESFGGATVVVEQTVRRLAQRGHEVAVLTGTRDRRMAVGQLHRYSALGVPVVAASLSGDPSAYNCPEIGESFRDLVSTLRPDVVHVHSLQGLGIDLVERSLDMAVPTVATLHDAWWLCERQFMVRSDGHWCGQTTIKPEVCDSCVPDPRAHRARQRRSLDILNRTQRVLAPSTYWVNLMARSGVSAEITGVNRNGVQLPAPGWERSPYDGPLRMGFVGGVDAVKGYPQLLAALRQIATSDYILRVVDSQSMLGVSSVTRADWPVAGTVDIVSAYTQQHLDGFFDSIDVLLFPSQAYESFGLTVREAIVRGVWPILTQGGGTQEGIVDGRNATVVPQDHAEFHLRRAIEAELAHWPHRHVFRPCEPPIWGFEQQTDDLLEHYRAALAR